MSQADTQVHVHPDALELAELLRPTWPAYSHELRLRPTLVCEGEGGGEGGEGGEGGGAGEGGGSGESGAGGQGGESKPPWGSDEEFDAKRAWKLIEATREDAKKAKAERDELRGKVKQHEDASKTEQEKAAERAAEAEKRATAAEQTALQLEVALDKAPEGMTLAQVRKLAKRLSGSSKEELEADAEELFADFPSDDGGGDQGSSRRPKERLRPGAAPGAEPEETDPKKLAASVSRTW